MQTAPPQTLPDKARLFVSGQENPTTCAEYFCKKDLVVIFGTPGAFTPTCTNKHVPGFLEQAKDIKSLGVDLIACITPNDKFVNDVWAKQIDQDGLLAFVSDANLEWTSALGLSEDFSERVMGKRFRRFALVASKGNILYFSPEKDKSSFEASPADRVVEFLKKRQKGG